MPTPAPIRCIVLSRRRTGAAGIFDLLSQYISRPNAGSEPFLWNRPLGHLSRAFHEGREREARQGLLDEMAKGVFFKHQYDTESYGFNSLVFSALKEADYRVVLVEREHEAERMFSAVVSMHFGAWSKGNLDQLRHRLAGGGVPITIDEGQVRAMVRADHVFDAWFRTEYARSELLTLRMTYEQFYRDGIGVLERADQLFGFAGLGSRSAVLSDESLLRSTLGGEHHTLALLQYSDQLRQAYDVIVDEIARLRVAAAEAEPTADAVQTDIGLAAGAPA